MILVISTCKDDLSIFEFVGPLQKLANGCSFKHYSELTSRDLNSADKIIISGTALADFDYLEGDWEWLKTFDKPVLGICAGMQVIAKTFGLKLAKNVIIGPQPVETVKDNPLCEGMFNAYFLHTYTAGKPFEILAKTNGKSCMIKHPEKQIYGVSFHPEVMNENIIKNFVKL